MAIQDKTRHIGLTHDSTKQDTIRQGMLILDEARQYTSIQYMASHDKTMQDNTRQHMTI